jgi:hypothetical protein
MCYSYRDHQLEEEALRIARERAERERREGRAKRDKKKRAAEKDRELVRA